MNVDEERLQEKATELKFQAFEKYIKHLSGSSQSRKIFEKTFNNEFEKYLNEDIKIDWKNEFPKRFKPMLK